MESPPHEVTDPAAFGRRVRELRRQLGLRQGELAADDISIAYVSRIESGQRRPEPRVVSLLADRLGTTVEYLLSGVRPDTAKEARLTLRYAELALHNGDAPDAEQRLRGLLDESGDALGTLRTEAEFLLARALEAVGRLDDAVHLLERLRAEPHTANPLDVFITLCRCYRDAGDLSRSIDVGEDGLLLARELQLDGTDDAVRLMVTVAAAYFERGDATYAAHLCDSAAEQAEQTASPDALASAYWNGSIIAWERGDVGLAIGLAERALALLGETSDERNLARLRVELASLQLRDDASNLEAIEHLIAQGRSGMESSSAGVVDLARCDVALAKLRLRQQDVDGAEPAAEQAYSRVVDVAPLMAAEAQILLGRCARARGNGDRARDRYRDALYLLSGAGYDREAAAVWYEIGGLLDEIGDVDAARDAYRGAAAAAGLHGTRSAAATINV